MDFGLQIDSINLLMMYQKNKNLKTLLMLNQVKNVCWLFKYSINYFCNIFLKIFFIQVNGD